MAGCGRFDAVAGKTGAEITRLDQNHVDTPRFDFHAQRLCQALQGKLGRAVSGLERDAHETCQRTHDDQMTRTLPPQVGKYRSANPPSAEKVGFELALDLVDVAVFHGSGQAESGIAYHNVDLFGFFDNEIHAGLDRRCMADVHGDHLIVAVSGRGAFAVRAPGGSTAGAIHAIATGA